MRNILKPLLIILMLLTLSTHNASARVFIGGGVVIGAPYYAYPPYYAYYPPYPYPAYPAYPAPYPYPPAYADPAYSYPLPPPSAQDRYYTENGEYCREYRHTIVVNGQPREGFGHACRQPDGSWRIMD